MDTEQPSAVCKYRWTKINETNSESVGFYPSYSQTYPVLLSWNEKTSAYFSNDVRIVCGNYHGNLVVDGKVYPVEEFSVRSYTFEVDLFLKESDEMPEKAESQEELEHVPNPASDLNYFTSLETPGKLELDNLESRFASDNETNTKHPLTENDTAMNKNQSACDGTTPSLYTKSNDYLSVSGMKRDSPIGNDDTSNFAEYNITSTNNTEYVEKNISSPQQITPQETLSKSEALTLDHTGLSMEVVEDVVRPSLKQISGKSSEVGGSAGDNLPRSRPPSIGADHVHGSQNESVEQSLFMDTNFNCPESKGCDRMSPESFKSTDSRKSDSFRPKSISEQWPDKSTSPANASQITPSRERYSHESTQLHSRESSQREPLGDNILSNKGRISENEFVGLSSSVPGRPPSHPSSRHSSLLPSRTQSLNSLTSDQELAQIFEHSRPTSYNSLLPGTKSEDSSVLRDTERPTNIPNWALPRDSDRRSVASTASRVSSLASSHTVTPTPIENGLHEVSSVYVKELEASVKNLRKVLASRETEVHSLTSKIEDLKDINHSVKKELDNRDKTQTSDSSVQSSFEYRQLLSEKEILASELAMLRDEMQRLTKGHKLIGGRNSAGSGITDYSPNSPAVLQRKIVDLEAHIHDLQEVTEATNSSLQRAEDKLKLLQEENINLRSRTFPTTDTQSQGDIDLRVELRTLKEDIRNLKERNFQLTEENMRLTESRKAEGIPNHSSSRETRTSNFSSDGVVSGQSSRYTANPIYRYDTVGLPGAHEFSYKNRMDLELPMTSKKTTHEDLAPREVRHTDLSRKYDLNSRIIEPEHIKYQSNSYSPHLHYQPRDGSKAESLKNGFLYPDRSKPDGEVSDKGLSNKYTKSVPSYEEITKDRASYLDKHSSYKPRPPRESTDLWKRDKSEDRRDNYKYGNDDFRDRYFSATSLERGPSSGLAISSRDIFLNLQQKRANKWLQQDNKYISGNLDLRQFQSRRIGIENSGDDSDTATDILLGQDASRKGFTRRRRNSQGSDDSPSSPSDLEDSGSSLLRRRSKSMDVKQGHKKNFNILHRSESSSQPLNSSGAAGFRSILPTPLVTQHNKGEMTSKSVTSLLSSSLTQGLRPFAPRGPADIRVDDVVKFSRLGGKLTQGLVKFIGHLPGRNETYLGVELDRDEGKHDGTFEGVRYFKCKPNKGVFVAFNKVVMAWAP